jgi:hypothetical protein
MATTKKRTSTAAKPVTRAKVRSASNGIAPIRAKARRVKDVPAHLEVGDDGWTVIVPDQPIAPLTVEQTRAAIDLVRR